MEKLPSSFNFPKNTLKGIFSFELPPKIRAGADVFYFPHLEIPAPGDLWLTVCGATPYLTPRKFNQVDASSLHCKS